MSDLPQGWVTAPLDEVISIIRGISFPKSAKFDGPAEGRVACLRTTNVQTNVEWSSLWFVPNTYVRRAEQFICPCDILISTANSLELVGKVAFVREVPIPAAIGAFIAAIRMQSAEVNPLYVFYYLTSERVKSDIRQTASTTTNISNLSISKLLTIPIQLAPLAEQGRIVEKIEALLSDLDAAIKSLEQALRRCDSYAISLLNQSASSAWPLVPLVDMAARITSGSRDWSQYYGRGSGTFIMAQNVRTSGLDLLFRQPVDPPESDSSCERSRVRLNDILVTIVGANTGETCMVDRDLHQHYVCQSVALIRLKNPEAAQFVSIYLAAPSGGQRQFDEFNYGAGRPHLSFEQLRATLVPSPPIEVQRRIIDHVQSGMAVVDQARSTLNANLLRAARLRQAILKQGFEGKLVPQDPNDEPASILLKRIRSERQSLNAPQKRLKRNNKPVLLTP